MDIDIENEGIAEQNKNEKVKNGKRFEKWNHKNFWKLIEDWKGIGERMWRWLGTYIELIGFKIYMVNKNELVRQERFKKAKQEKNPIMDSVVYVAVRFM